MITIVTGNNGKYTQISSVLEAGGIFVEQRAIDLVEPQSNDMMAVSATKARQAFEVVGGPVLVDDSGIFFDAYPDFPGVFSKYMFESLGIDGMQRLFTDEVGHGAFFQCVLSYMDVHLETPVQFVGTTRGSIDFRYIGQIVIDPHLPYLSFFVPVGRLTVAQADPEYKRSSHHRARASKQLLEFLKNNQINEK